MNRMCLLLMCVVLTGLVTGCEHKDLCYDHETHTPRVEYLLSLSYDTSGSTTWKVTSSGNNIGTRITMTSVPTIPRVYAFIYIMKMTSQRLSGTLTRMDPPSISRMKDIIRC